MLSPAFERELRALVEKYKVHETAGLSVDLTVSSICTQLQFFAKTPQGCPSYAPIPK